MKVTVKREKRHAIIYLEGDTVGLMPGPIPEVLSCIHSGARDVILDLSGLRFLNPNGIEAIKDTIEIAKKQDVGICITSPPAQIRRTLKLSKLSNEIPIFFSIREALTKLDLLDYPEKIKTESADCLLICQKNLPIAGALRHSLKQHPMKPSYRIIPVRDLKQGFETLLEEKIDCILLDSAFPLIQITNFIQAVETDNRIPSIPIIVVTSDDKLDEVDAIIRNGAHDVLRYPFHSIEVVVRIQTLISHLKDHRPFEPPEKVVQPRGWHI